MQLWCTAGLSAPPGSETIERQSVPRRIRTNDLSIDLPTGDEIRPLNPLDQEDLEMFGVLFLTRLPSPGISVPAIPGLLPTLVSD